ncbi:MAG: hypothetical protein QM811_23870 [Pirellulales bacterium]
MNLATPGDGVGAGNTGNWSTVIANWDNGSSHVAWPTTGTDNDAIFSNSAGGATTVVTAVTANDLIFITPTSVGGSSSVTLNGVSPGIESRRTATITAPLRATTGFAKRGSGLLTIDGTTSGAAITGTVVVEQGQLALTGGTSALGLADLVVESARKPSF